MHQGKGLPEIHFPELWDCVIDQCSSHLEHEENGFLVLCPGNLVLVAPLYIFTCLFLPHCGLQR